MDNNKSHAEHNFDYLVLGSGIAGLFFALKACKHGSVAIITKKERAESNTNHAQGGIAAVTSKEDSVEMHIQDTLIAGAGLCDEEAVRIIVTEGPARIADLISYGTHFTEREIPDSNGARELDLGREGGHSKRRVLHAGDITGHQVEIALLDAVSKESNICFFEHHFAIDLILSNRDPQSSDRRCIGAYVLDAETNQVETFRGKHVILATGGCGKVYLYTTNPYIATGDGLAMAWRAGAAIANMEFIQFHPTCLYDPKGGSFLISEAVRGEGAILKNLDGSEFMQNYDKRLSLAPRDIVARAIGVKTNMNGQTTVPGLYAIGEVACTGLHGANRLASNSLLEAIVMAQRVAQYTVNEQITLSQIPIPPWQSGNAQNSDELVVLNHNWDEIRRLMWDYVGIVRTTRRLERARTRIENIIDEIREYYWDFTVTKEILELRNIARVAWIIIVSALSRKESRGLHYTLDYPNSDPALSQKNTLLIRSVEPKS